MSVHYMIVLRMNVVHEVLNDGPNTPTDVIGDSSAS